MADIGEAAAKAAASEAVAEALQQTERQIASRVAAEDPAGAPAAGTSQGAEVGVPPYVAIVPGKPSEHGGSPVIPVLVKVQPPKALKRAPSDIVCVIDVSGSMGCEAKIMGTSGVEESHGLTLLDIAKHGVKTVIHTLGPEDRLAIASFNHGSNLVLPLTLMDDAGKTTAVAQLETLQEGGGTNIWLGLMEGLDALEQCYKSEGATGRLGHVMLLTDGQTSERDRVMERLRQEAEQCERLPGTISTFGFGYSIDSELLCDIAAFGESTYSFIPDAGMVGTCFVNTMSNLLVTMAKGVEVVLETESIEVVGVMGPYEHTKKDDELRIKLGTLQYEQERGVVVLVSQPPAGRKIGGNVAYEDITLQKKHSEFVEVPLTGDGVADPDGKVDAEMIRSMFTENVMEAVKKAKIGNADALAQAQGLIKAIATRINESPAKSRPEMAAMLEDVEGQSALAVSRNDWFQKWGNHYLRSITFAHKVQQCNNFKDPSVQLYGGEMFKDIQDKADDMFNSLPAPTASRPAYSYSSAPAASVNMSAYNDRYGVCIDASSAVRLARSDEMRTVGELQKGDLVAAVGGLTAEVVCLVRTACEDSKAVLVELPGGARVTPYHPVLFNGKWLFPVDIASAQEQPCVAVCSVVLKGAPALLVGNGEDGGVPCAGLGHGLREGAAEHPYFGTASVLEDLEKAPGFDQGLVEVRPGNVVRDPETSLVCSFHFG